VGDDKGFVVGGLGCSDDQLYSRTFEDCVSLHISKHPSFEYIHQTRPDWRYLARGTVDLVHCEAKYANDFVHCLYISTGITMSADLPFAREGDHHEIDKTVGTHTEVV
jgi:hypothetical protein